jgi:hypothetical protein
LLSSFFIQKFCFWLNLIFNCLNSLLICYLLISSCIKRRHYIIKTCKKCQAFFAIFSVFLPRTRWGNFSALGFLPCFFKQVYDIF